MNVQILITLQKMESSNPNSAALPGD